MVIAILVGVHRAASGPPLLWFTIAMAAECVTWPAFLETQAKTVLDLR